MNIILYLLISLKFITPLLTLVFPFGASWANYFYDAIDGDILSWFNLQENYYQIIDKSADLFFYSVILIYGLKLPIKKEIVITYIIRVSGQVLFFVTQNEIFFFFFPNLIEPLFLIYVSIHFFKKIDWNSTHKIYLKHKRLIWIMILIYKFQEEYMTHVINLDRTEFLLNLFG